jgi:hypothetical protein
MQSKYGTIDVGYDWFRDPGNRFATFVGYNVLNQEMKAFGCSQIANPFSDCSTPVPDTVLGITESDRCNRFALSWSVISSLRLI